MSDITDRLALPLLAAGQAQKEVTHNEALTLADLLLLPAVESVAPATVPTSPTPGKGWIVGATPTGAWAGQAHKLAFWTVGGWRFVAAPEGATLWSVADSQPVRRSASGWVVGQLRASTVSIGGNQVVGARLAAVTVPTGGTTVDAEARATLGAILDRLRTHGLIAS